MRCARFIQTNASTPSGNFFATPGLAMPGCASITCCSARRWPTGLLRQRLIVRCAPGRRPAITPRHGSNLAAPNTGNDRGRRAVHWDAGGKAMLIATLLGRGVFKAAALLGAFVLIVGLWLWDASLLTMVADENLRLLKAVTSLFPLDWASKIESALRIFGADRALLLIEGVAVAKLVMLSLAYPFRGTRP